MSSNLDGIDEAIKKLDLNEIDMKPDPSSHSESPPYASSSSTDILTGDYPVDSQLKYRTWDFDTNKANSPNIYSTNSSYYDTFLDSGRISDMPGYPSAGANNYKIYATEDYGTLNYSATRGSFDSRYSISPGASSNEAGALFSVQTYKSRNPTRSVLLYNVPATLSLKDLFALFSTYGDVEAIYPARKDDLGVLLVVYYDILDASLAVEKISDPSFPVNVLFSTNLVPSKGGSMPQQYHYEDNKLLFLNANNTKRVFDIASRYGRVFNVSETNSGVLVEFTSTKSCAKAYARLSLDVSVRVVPVPVDAAGIRLGNSLSTFIKSEHKLTPATLHLLNQASMYQVGATEKNLHLPMHHGYTSSQSFHSVGSMRQMVPPKPARKKHVVPEEFKLDLNRISKGEDPRSTIMVRNIPNKYTQKMLLEELDVLFKGKYDFFYLPIDFKNKCNVGYAFVNMIDFHNLIEVYNTFNNKHWTRFNSEKVCEVTYAKIQGKLSLINRFKNSSLMLKGAECRPLIFYSEGEYKGMSEVFPAPDLS
eukprot:augustus_masked-scaffold_5-processed-gene-13.13-mRNA-1 protein AED:0.03 eAED:0.66 QI:0/-1/0/1/-1/1/1/0/533